MERVKKRVVKLPSSYVIIFSIIAIIGIITQFVPGIQAATVSDVLSAPISGFEKGVGIILSILIIGGFIKIVNSTGVLVSGVSVVVKKMKGKEILLIPLVMFIISIGGTTYGMSDETIALYPIVIGAFLLCGYDVLTGTATILCGVICGVSGSTINPFSIGAAVDALQSSTGIEVNQTLILLMGCFVWLSSYAVSAFFVMQYAKKVQKDPEFSLMTKAEKENGTKEFGNPELFDKEPTFDSTAKLTLILFGLSFLIMIVALIPWENYGISIFEGWTSFLTGNAFGDWYFSDLSLWFLIMTIAIALINRMKESQFISIFMSGAGEMVGVAFILGLSRGVAVLMSTTGFDEYLLNIGMNALSGVSRSVFAVGAYALYTGFTFLITSTSGLAAASIPTLGGLAYNLGFAPEVMISIYIGAHFIVGLIPTSGTVMGSLGMARLEYTTWIKLYGKIYAVITLINLVFFSIMMNIL
jgi:uncharacterized ion transporter superfamily protein YfcC